MKYREFYVNVFNKHFNKALQKSAFEVGYMWNLSTESKIEYPERTYLKFTAQKTIVGDNNPYYGAEKTIPEALSYFNSLEQPEFKENDYVFDGKGRLLKLHFYENTDNEAISLALMSGGFIGYYGALPLAEFIHKYYDRHATDEEIQSHLVAELEKRYKVGDEYICLDDGSPQMVRPASEYNYSSDTDDLFCATGTIYHSGTFAEIIKEETTEIADAMIKQEMFNSQVAEPIRTILDDFYNGILPDQDTNQV